MDINLKVEQFTKSLDEKQILALQIAQNHLGTSFDISKCNGFKEYISQQK